MKHNYPKQRKKFEKIYLIYNKKASSNHKPSTYLRVLDNIWQNVKPMELFIVPHEKIEDIQVDDETVLLIYGGDGTIHNTITYLYTKKRVRTPLIIGHLRGGTMNTIATCLKIPKNSEIIEKLKSGNREVEVIPRNSIKVEIDGGSKELYGFMFGGGKLVYNFLKYYYEGKILGPTGAVKTLLTTIAKAVKGDRQISGRYKLRIKIWDIQRQEENDFLIFGAGTIHSFGLNFSNFPKAPQSKNSFNFIAYAGSTVKLISFLPLIYFGILPQDAINEQATKVTVESLNSEDVGFTLDGDLYSAKTFTLTPGPELYFIV